MARPAEKARNMLNKWVAMREQGNAPVVPRRPPRPHLASECQNLKDAERYRRQIIREMALKIKQIQNPALPQSELRDLNDSINQLQRQKYHWNKRIHQLGGADFNAIERKRQIDEGDTQLYASYRYYGAAKDLPGVKEHMEKQAKRRIKVDKKSELQRRIDPDYFGFRDEDDGVLLEREMEMAEKIKPNISEAPVIDFFAGVPTQEEVDAIILEQKKKALMMKYSL